MKISWKFFFQTLLALIFFSGRIYFAQDNNILARIGNKELDQEEFIRRYELSPHLSMHSFSTDSLKNEFLYSLIAEKLWALEAEHRGLDAAEAIRMPMGILEKLYVKDALYKEEIDSKINLTKNDISTALKRNSIRLKVDVISSEDSVKIFHIYSLILSGLPFDSLTGKQSFEVSFGQMNDEFIEDTLFSMQTGSVSQPLRTAKAWFIFKLKDKTTSTLEDNSENMVKKAERIIRNRRAKQMYTDYKTRFFSGIKINTSALLFRSMRWKIFRTFSAKTLRGKNSQTQIALEESDILKIINSYTQDSLQMVYIYLNRNPVTLKDFLYSLSTGGFAVKKVSMEEINLSLRTSTRETIETELLSLEGFKRGLNNLPEVKRNMLWWKENYLAHLIQAKFSDSVHVGDEEAYALYKGKNIMPLRTFVNIVEILNSSLDTMQIILDKLRDGTDIRDLARIYNERESTKNTDGEFGFFPAEINGDIGKAAGNMNIGDIYGPLRVPEGYSIFKVTGRKEIRDSLPENFDQVKDKLLKEAFLNKLNSYLKHETVKLARKYGLKINYANLNAITITKINMFVQKILGFGGKIVAVPLTPNFYEWNMEWQSKPSL